MSKRVDLIIRIINTGDIDESFEAFGKDESDDKILFLPPKREDVYEIASRYEEIAPHFDRLTNAEWSMIGRFVRNFPDAKLGIDKSAIKNLVENVLDENKLSPVEVVHVFGPLWHVLLDDFTGVFVSLCGEIECYPPVEQDILDKIIDAISIKIARLLL